MVTQHFFPEIPREDILQKFVGIRYTGRFQKIEEGLYVDIAHNQDKVRALADEITDRFSDKRKIFIVGLSGARHAKEIFPPILAIADEVIITTASYKGVPVDTLERELRDINEREIPLTVLPEPQEALKYAKRLQKENTIVILTGSTYMIDQVLNPDPFLRYINASYGWRTQKSI
jgi:dihydrofolate synthase/folylpolyglutamate synthase